VCIDPTVIPKIVAKFISPEEVRTQLLTNKEEFTFLSEKKISFLLDTSNER
jgi:hypothetical protein